MSGWVPRGLTLGASAHMSVSEHLMLNERSMRVRSQGACSLVDVNEIDAASIATMAYAVVGTMACLLLAVPPIRDSLLRIAGA